MVDHPDPCCTFYIVQDHNVTITIQNLTFTYTGSDHPAIIDISLSIPDGGFYGIIGANGAGKSTLCRTFIGFVPHFFTGKWVGEAMIDGYSIPTGTIQSLATKVGFVFQNPFDQLTGAADTIFKEIAFGLEQTGVPPNEITERVNKAIASVGLAGKEDRHPFFLSGGQQQRLAIAAVLALEPSILVLDEATSQLDPVGTAEVFSLASKLHQQGKTIVMVEHKLDRLARYADRIAVLHKGRLVLDDNTSRVLSDPRLPEWNLRHPVITALGMKLRETGLSSGPLPMTVEEAEMELRSLLE